MRAPQVCMFCYAAGAEMHRVIGEVRPKETLLDKRTRTIVSGPRQGPRREPDERTRVGPERSEE